MTNRKRIGCMSSRYWAHAVSYLAALFLAIVIGRVAAVGF